MAYIIGAVLGDGYVQLDEYSYIVFLAVKDYELAEEFSRWVTTVLGRKTIQAIMGEE